MSKRKLVLTVSCAVVCAAFFASHAPSAAVAKPKHLILLQTNDIHGGVEPVVQSDGSKVGGTSIFGGIVKATKAGVQAEYGEDGGVLVLDDGDQFQGTLISNYNEGSLAFDEHGRDRLRRRLLLETTITTSARSAGSTTW